VNLDLTWLGQMPTVTLANTICTAAELSEVLGVTDRRVRQLTHDGVLKCARSKNGVGRYRYRLADSVQRFVSYEKESATELVKHDDDDYNRARGKRMAAMAALAELELAVKRGEYLRKDDVGFWVTLMIRNFRDRCLAIPSRTMFQLVGLTDAREANKVVGNEINIALTELSETKLRECFKEEREAYLESQGAGLSQLNGEERVEA
jgi:phage terminase Nu1 subunit (DNA packaging protein)